MHDSLRIPRRAGQRRRLPSGPEPPQDADDEWSRRCRSRPDRVGREERQRRRLPGAGSSTSTKPWLPASTNWTPTARRALRPGATQPRRLGPADPRREPRWRRTTATGHRASPARPPRPPGRYQAPRLPAHQRRAAAHPSAERPFDAGRRSGPLRPGHAMRSAASASHRGRSPVVARPTGTGPGPPPASVTRAASRQENGLLGQLRWSSSVTGRNAPASDRSTSGRVVPAERTVPNDQK